MDTEKLTPKEDLYEWIVDIEEPLKDDLLNIASSIGKRNNWDMVEIQEMVDDMTGKVIEGILNVVSVYEKQ